MGHSLQRRLNRWGALFVLPAVLFFAMFSIYPMASAIYNSFFEYDMLTPRRFVGLGNYIDLVHSAEFWRTVSNTIVYVVGTVVPVWFMSMLVALLLNTSFYGQGIARSLFFVPVVMPLVAVCLVWKLLFYPSGVINTILGKRILWLVDGRYSLLSTIIMSWWHALGYYMVVLLAGLKDVPISLYEAAKIAGANRWQAFRYITLPMMRGTITFVIIVSILNGLKTFVPQRVLTNGGPANLSNVITLEIYRQAFEFLRMGRAATISVMLFVSMLVLTIVQLKVLHYDEV